MKIFLVYLTLKLLRLLKKIFKLSLNLFTPKGFPIDELNRLALGRVKSISALWAPTGVKGLITNTNISPLRKICFT